MLPACLADTPAACSCCAASLPDTPTLCAQELLCLVPRPYAILMCYPVTDESDAAAREGAHMCMWSVCVCACVCVCVCVCACTRPAMVRLLV